MMGMTSPMMSKVASNVFINGPGISMTLKANIPTIDMKIYCPSRPKMNISLAHIYIYIERNLPLHR